jgi:hypothetical protein
MDYDVFLGKRPQDVNDSQSTFTTINNGRWNPIPTMLFLSKQAPVSFNQSLNSVFNTKTALLGNLNVAFV